ncbi:MATE family efflux transporter [Bradyrhizobium sp. SSUT18]|uniref:MATE family efflux transporter n=1 Tax=Bradyrhizobium sp. SSUT18 TaxID=3040602 RepID=UPI00244A5A48|nr:MATE family efflux transporter [Bradyrhizobium sp. SSUT18]MDH2406837.1 MATE family efflux transporter [Bradyrhizobium sp. SSUT18]
MTLPIVVLLAAAGQGIGVGTASFISRHLGAGEYLEASRGASTALALAAPIGIIVTVALLLNLRGIFVTLGASPTIMPVALDYAATLLFGYTLMLLNIVNGFIVRAEGNTRFSMWTMITAFILNAVLDPVSYSCWTLVCEAQPSRRWYLKSLLLASISRILRSFAG